MKVLTVNHSDSVGSAAKSAHRIHRALLRHGVDSRMLVNHEGTDDWTVEGPASSAHKLMSKAAPQLAAQWVKLRKGSDSTQRSPAVVPSPWTKRINASDAAVVHLHWVQNEMLTIGAIGRISKPLVWTLHDMWPFCGTEHFAANERWREGYKKNNRADDERGWDIDRWAWSRKQKSWRKPIHMIAPTQWLADAAHGSALMRNWPVAVIPNALDTDAWTPIEKSNARRLLNLSEGIPVLAFGAWSYASSDEGFDLLIGALRLLKSRGIDLQLLIVRQNAPREPVAVDYPVRYAGPLHDELSLRIAYSATDAMIVPSKLESFCEMAAEAQSCGTPVVAFDATGMRDMVEHQSTGYLAKAFDVEDLAHGIEWVVSTKERSAQLGTQARQRAIQKYSYSAVAEQLTTFYAEVISAS